MRRAIWIPAAVALVAFVVTFASVRGKSADARAMPTPPPATQAPVVSATAPEPPAKALAEAACGAAGLPECPLQAWMKANAGPAMTAADTKRLERAFTRIAAFSPAGFANWEAIAREGSAAASKGDVEGCRRACKTCHDQHRARYRAERRAAPL